MAYLKSDTGVRHELNAPISIMGRHPDCNIIVEVGAVSRQHAQIVRENGKFYIEDLQSRNGTYLNDTLIPDRQPLFNNDVIRICDVDFTFLGGADRIGSPPRPPAMGEKQTIDIDSGSSSGLGSRAILIDESPESGSTIMSKLDVSSRYGRVQLTASPEAKLKALIEITQNLGKALALDQVLPGVLDSLFKIFVQADRGFIVLRGTDGNLVPMWTKLRRDDSNDTIRISRTIVRQVMDAKEAVLSADAASDSRFEMSESIADFRIRSMMCAPLLDSEGESMGVLQVDTLDQRKRFQPEDLEVLGSVAAQAGIAIDNAQMHEQALQQRELQRDLEVAHEVQKGFLPNTRPEIPGYSFYDYYEPANHIGGDYFDYIKLPDGRLAVIVADVVGHGVAAALLMAKLAAEAKFSLASESQADVAVNRLNDVMSGLQLDRFVTLIMAVLNPQTHEVTIVNAGHMAPMWRRAGGAVEEPGESLAGLPVGITSGLEYEPLTITLAPGESLTLYTDGLNECSNRVGEMYGIERLRKLIKSADVTTPAALGETVMQDVRGFLSTGPQDDDMCLVCFGRAT